VTARSPAAIIAQASGKALAQFMTAMQKFTRRARVFDRRFLLFHAADYGNLCVRRFRRARFRYGYWGSLQ
jgi:hypothetical protein